jgi:peptidoglycan/LPS O-acetylase OafA/YrhL
MRWVWLAGAILLTAVQASSAIASAPSGPFGLEHTDLMAYLWILTFLGWARKSLNFGTVRLQKANEAVLPFYILHQPVLVSIGYFVVGWAIPDLAKWMIIFASSFIVVMALYEFLVQRFNILRFLFGMKMLVKPSELPAMERQPKEAPRMI